MEMEKKVKVPISATKSTPQISKGQSTIKRTKTVGYVFLSGGMIIAEK